MLNAHDYKALMVDAIAQADHAETEGTAEWWSAVRSLYPYSDGGALMGVWAESISFELASRGRPSEIVRTPARHA